MSTARMMFDEDALAGLIEVFVNNLETDVLRYGFDEPTSGDIKSEVRTRVSSAVIHALQVEFSNLGFIGIGNPKLLTCDMPNNGHQFKPSSKSKHCASCGADYCPSHPLANCVKCGRIL